MVYVSWNAFVTCVHKMRKFEPIIFIYLMRFPGLKIEFFKSLGTKDINKKKLRDID